MYLEPEISKKNYYCLVAGLPNLILGESKPVFSSVFFRRQLKQLLTKNDYFLVNLIFLPTDNQNLLNILFNLNTPFNNNGNFSKDFLENQIRVFNQLPEYMVLYLKWVKKQETTSYQLQYETKLHQYFMNHILKQRNEFLMHWFAFDHHLKNKLTKANCKQYNYNSSDQVIISELDIDEDSVTNSNILSLNDELPFEEEVNRIIESPLGLLEKEKAIDRLRWNFLEGITFFHYFSIERILSFIIKLMIIERWSGLDTETGKKALEKLIQDLRYRH